MLPSAAKIYFDTLWGERSGQAWQDLAEQEQEFDRKEGAQRGRQGYAARLSRILQDSLQARSSSILVTLLEVHGDFQSPSDDGVEDMLADWGARSLSVQLQGLESHFIRKLASFGVGPKFCTNLDQTAPLCQVQIENGVRRHLWKLRNVPMKKPGTHLQSANSPVINVAGSVGGIFTGNGASATINQRVEARQDALIDALETLAKAIASEKSLEVALQTSLAHDARSAAAEVASPQPRYGRIASLLGGIAASVGTLGAIKPAIEAVLDMATAAGIELP